MPKKWKFSDNSRIKPRHKGGTKEKLRNVPSRIFNILSFCHATRRISLPFGFWLVMYQMQWYISFTVIFFLCVSLALSEFSFHFFLHRFAASNGSSKLGENQTKRISRTLLFALCLFVRTQKYTYTYTERWENLVWIKIVEMREKR